KDVLAAFYIFSKNQQLKSGINFHNFSLEAIWNESVVDLNIGLDQLQTDSYARLTSTIDIAEDSTTIVFEPSDIKLPERHWKFDKDNFISISRDDVRVKNVMLYNENQFLSANGNINQNPEDFLYVEVNELNMNFLNALDLREFEGTANGLMAFNGFYDHAGTKGGLKIRDLHINKFLIGDIVARTDFEEGRPQLNLTNVREGKKIIEVDGFFGAGD